MVIPPDLLFLVPVGTAQITNFVARPSGTGAVQGQPDEAAGVESFVALGLTHRGHRRAPRHLGVEPCGEIPERVIAETGGNIQGATGARTHQRFNPGEGHAA